MVGLLVCTRRVRTRNTEVLPPLGEFSCDGQCTVKQRHSHTRSKKATHSRARRRFRVRADAHQLKIESFQFGSLLSAESARECGVFMRRQYPKYARGKNCDSRDRTHAKRGARNAVVISNVNWILMISERCACTRTMHKAFVIPVCECIHITPRVFCSVARDPI